MVRRAKEEISTGVHVQLDWPLHNIEFPGFGRVPLKHSIKDLKEEGFVAYDDVISINTQTSSQWDSLKHVSFLASFSWELSTDELPYSGEVKIKVCITTAGPTKSWGEYLILDCTVCHSPLWASPYLAEVLFQILISIDICNRGGIVGRGILVDWVSSRIIVIQIYLPKSLTRICGACSWAGGNTRILAKNRLPPFLGIKSLCRRLRRFFVIRELRQDKVIFSSWEPDSFAGISKLQSNALFACFIDQYWIIAYQAKQTKPLE